MKAAADSGNGKALIMYSKSLYRKIEEVAHCMKLAVDKTDDVEMIRFYARLLHDGLGVEANKEDIAHYFEIATMRNDPQSFFQLAEILYNVMIPPRPILLVLAEFFYSLAEILTSKIFGPGPKGPGPIISN